MIPMYGQVWEVFLNASFSFLSAHEREYTVTGAKAFPPAGQLWPRAQE